MLWSAKLMLGVMLITLTTGCDKPSSFRISTQFNVQTADGISQAPYLLPKCFDEWDARDLKIVISEVGIEGLKAPNCNIPRNEDNPDFSLQWAEARTTSGKAWEAQISVKAEAVFSDKEADRNRLKNSFQAFQTALSALEEDENHHCLKPGGAGIIGQRIAAALPLRMDEILTFHYGLDPDNRVIDLEAGMRLRIEQGAYQFTDPQDDASNAYVGRGVSYLHVIRKPDQTLAFEAYLGALKSVETHPELGRTRMISGAMGLASVGIGRRYARLVYPSQYPNTAETNPVLAEGELPMRVGLLLADRARDLETATRMVIADSRCAANENNSVMCFYFSGRSFVIPEVLVNIQGVERYVSIGTTLRDILNRYMTPSVEQIGHISERGYAPELFRRLTPGLCQRSDAYQAMGISFESASPVTPSKLTQWDMPLLKGDTLRW